MVPYPTHHNRNHSYLANKKNSKLINIIYFQFFTANAAPEDCDKNGEGERFLLIDQKFDAIQSSIERAYAILSKVNRLFTETETETETEATKATKATILEKQTACKTRGLLKLESHRQTVRTELKDYCDQLPFATKLAEQNPILKAIEKDTIVEMMDVWTVELSAVFPTYGPIGEMAAPTQNVDVTMFHHYCEIVYERELQQSLNAIKIYLSDVASTTKAVVEEKVKINAVLKHMQDSVDRYALEANTRIDKAPFCAMETEGQHCNNIQECTSVVTALYAKHEVHMKAEFMDYMGNLRSVINDFAICHCDIIG